MLDRGADTRCSVGEKRGEERDERRLEAQHEEEHEQRIPNVAEENPCQNERDLDQGGVGHSSPQEEEERVDFHKQARRCICVMLRLKEGVQQHEERRNMMGDDCRWTLDDLRQRCDPNQVQSDVEEPHVSQQHVESFVRSKESVERAETKHKKNPDIDRVVEIRSRSGLPFSWTCRRSRGRDRRNCFDL